jgi:hypothetical protein
LHLLRVWFSPAADEVHELDGIAFVHAGRPELRPADDFPIEFDHDCSRIEGECVDEIEERTPRRYLPLAPVYRYRNGCRHRSHDP